MHPSQFPLFSFFLVLPSLLLHHHTLAVPTNTNATGTDLTATPTTPNFSLVPKVPFPNQNNFQLLNMLFLTCEGLFTWAPYAFTGPAPGGDKQTGTLKIRVEAGDVPATAFQIRHVLWGLWQAAVKQLSDNDYRAGIFVLDAGSGSSLRSVGSITYSTNNAPLDDLIGNGTTGGIESITTPDTGIDVTSRRRRRSLQERDATTLAPQTNSNLTSFPGFSNTTTTTPVNIPPYYNIGITGRSADRISFTSVFITVFETMVTRASLPTRATLTGEWYYTCENTGYVFGIKPPPEQPAGTSPPFEAMMGSMANLPRALQQQGVNVEVLFDVFEGVSGKRVLQGFLVNPKDGVGSVGFEEVGARMTGGDVGTD